MKKTFRKFVLLMVCAAWTMLCVFSFLAAYFTEHDLLAGVSVVIWFVVAFIFDNDIERGLK